MTVSVLKHHIIYNQFRSRCVISTYGKVKTSAWVCIFLSKGNKNTLLSFHMLERITSSMCAFSSQSCDIGKTWLVSCNDVPDRILILRDKIKLFHIRHRQFFLFCGKSLRKAFANCMFIKNWFSHFAVDELDWSKPHPTCLRWPETNIRQGHLLWTAPYDSVHIGYS